MKKERAWEMVFVSRRRKGYYSTHHMPRGGVDTAQEETFRCRAEENLLRDGAALEAADNPKKKI